MTTAAETMQTRDQEIAKYAWDRVHAVVEDKGLAKKYGTTARKLSSLIQVNGLGQTLAFLLAKAKLKENKRGDAEKAHQYLYRNLQEWLIDQQKVFGAGISGAQNDLIQLVMNNPSATYRRATSEAVRLAVWLKRFAEAEIPDEDGET